MGSESEPAKLLLPFLQRADELQKHEPLVAYYCRLYAMEKGLKIPQKERTKTTNSILISLMNQLEKDKKSLKLGPEDYLYVEGFASNVFAKADKQDRAGRADLNTAKTFYAASIFFEILNQFGELQPDIEQKLKYAVWKAADIRKAMKEGRKPEPGPPGGDKDLSLPSSSPTSAYDIGSNESFSTSKPVAGSPSQHVEKDFGRSESFQNNYTGADLPSQPLDRVNSYNASHPPASPSTYPTNDYPPGGYHQPSPSNSYQPPPSGTPDISSYPQHYHSQSYPNDQQPISQNYHPENPSPPYSCPNFQTYPSFHDTSFPAAPTHQPSYYHDADASFSRQSSAPSVPNYPSQAMKYDSGAGNGNHVAPQAPPPAAPTYTYDSNYQPPVEKIYEAHKAARFAVGALAFDDVPVAVEFLRKSLELLTNPSAQTP
ncbi:uncharacterized protein A4U43_C05F21120 [Asparagus officinalis]|uniref:Vta1/callose synthase N-terminal domain-containing protein n=1 Tax=Asparagus officinalis TaxID=4686 RepID=A0A5P1ETF6_ASPOF|nr:protein HOMOLOG OF MAMMALIAN LYST-INTERACTING PROTEIN 5 [Asparagus officinalis]ONK69272.1 uncharacterized protein A4U43_C05F21120 [Asparagus officinalis]